LIDDLGRALDDFLSRAQGRSFCDDCLAIELQVNRLDVRPALDGTPAPMDRGHGRCSVCGQMLTMIRVATE